MIVTDTNLVAYLLLPNPMEQLAERVWRKDNHWVVPRLLFPEFRNVLALHMRRGNMKLEDAIAYAEQAEAMLFPAECEPSSRDVLRLSDRSGCTAYDCEFAALAETLNVPLVTADGQVLRAFPGLAISPADFAAEQG